MEGSRFSHMDADGAISMVDVGHKAATQRTAISRCSVLLSPATFALLQEKALPKGDVLTTAKIAGIMAAKRTHELIPLCHPLALSYADVRFELDQQSSTVHIEAEARTAGATGVEMEALTAVQVAALTMYDMCKAVQKDIIITNCRLVYKNGGKSGEFRAK